MTAPESGDELDAGRLLVRSIVKQMNTSDLDTITSSQRESLSRFEKTNEMLSNCNTLSSSRLSSALKELQPYKQMITEMKRDLEIIFRRIRAYKQSFAQTFPEAFAAAQSDSHAVGASEDDEESEKPPTVAEQGHLPESK